MQRARAQPPWQGLRGAARRGTAGVRWRDAGAGHFLGRGPGSPPRRSARAVSCDAWVLSPAGAGASAPRYLAVPHGRGCCNVTTGRGEGAWRGAVTMETHGRGAGTSYSPCVAQP